MLLTGAELEPLHPVVEGGPVGRHPRGAARSRSPGAHDRARRSRGDGAPRQGGREVPDGAGGVHASRRTLPTRFTRCCFTPRSSVDRWTDLTRRIGGTPLSERPPEEVTRAFIGAMHVVSAPRAAEMVDGRRRSEARGGSWTSARGRERTRPPSCALRRCSRRRSSTSRPSSRSPASGSLGAGLLGSGHARRGRLRERRAPGGITISRGCRPSSTRTAPRENDALFGRIFRALAPGGRLVIRDHVMEPDRTRPRAGALFAVNMLVGTALGGTYTFDEIRAGLERAGFVRVRALRAGDQMDALVEAFRPPGGASRSSPSR